MQQTFSIVQKRLARELAALPADTPEWTTVCVDVSDLSWQPGIRQDAPHVFWSAPDESVTRVAAGRLATTRSDGRDALATLAAAHHSLMDNHLLTGPAADRLTDFVFAGFPFRLSRPGAALLYLPQVILEQRAGQWLLAVSAHRSSLSEPEALLASWLEQLRSLERGNDNDELPAGTLREADPEDWARRVQDALEAIDKGALDKVVLSRTLKLNTAHPPALNTVLDRLRSQEPESTVFALNDGMECLIGASPEYLASQRARELRADAMAGTLTGTTQTGEISDKLLREHHIVLDDIRAALADCSDELEHPESPLRKTLAHCEHLWSPIRATLKPGISLLNVAARLHPTPAVAGAPRSRAVEWLESRVSAETRGWYTGAVGWLDRHGGGNLLVTLRCGVLRASEAVLYAGAGIVRGSCADEEFDETRFKFLTMLNALGGIEQDKQ